MRTDLSHHQRWMLSYIDERSDRGREWMCWGVGAKTLDQMPVLSSLVDEGLVEIEEGSLLTPLFWLRTTNDGALLARLYGDP